jgi:hypothetical protein
MATFDIGISWVATDPQPKEFTHGFPMLPGQHTVLYAVYEASDTIVDALVECAERAPSSIGSIVATEAVKRS